MFDLECSKGHGFEGWFEGIESFENQKEKKLILCPYCNDSKVKRVMSAVAVKKSQPDGGPPQDSIDYRRLAKEVVDYVQKNFEEINSFVLQCLFLLSSGRASDISFFRDFVMHFQGLSSEIGTHIFKILLNIIDNFFCESAVIN